MSSLFNAAVKPKSLHNDLLLTFDTAISHHDPAVQDKSNKLLFNRQKQLLYAPAQDYFVRQESINRFCAAFQFPIEMVDIIEDLDFASFTAVCAIGLFIRLYGRGDGSGHWKRPKASANSIATITDLCFPDLQRTKRIASTSLH